MRQFMRIGATHLPPTVPTPFRHPTDMCVRSYGLGYWCMLFGMSVEALETCVGSLRLDPSPDTLARVLMARDRLDAEISACVGAFDDAGRWALDGSTSAIAWLSHHGGQSGREASRWVRSARRLASLPVLSSAWRSGTLWGGQVQAVLANLSEETAPLFAEHESEVVPALTGLSVADTARAMALWAARAEALVERPEPAEPTRSLHLSETLDGRGELSGSFDPEGASLLATALRQAGTDDVEGEPPRSAPRRRADALVDVCRFFLEHRSGPSSARHRPHLNVNIDWDDVVGAGPGMTTGGASFDPATIERLLCDAGVHRVLRSGRSSILDYGATTRTVPVNLWNALVLRDGHCRFGACDRGPEWCEAHHILPWAVGGETSLANLALGCGRHHHVLHQPGWHLKLLPDATVEVTTPDGQVLISEAPRPPPRPPGPSAEPRQE